MKTVPSYVLTAYNLARDKAKDNFAKYRMMEVSSYLETMKETNEHCRKALEWVNDKKNPVNRILFYGQLLDMDILLTDDTLQNIANLLFRMDLNHLFIEGVYCNRCGHFHYHRLMRCHYCGGTFIYYNISAKDFLIQNTSMYAIESVCDSFDSDNPLLAEAIQLYLTYSGIEYNKKLKLQIRKILIDKCMSEFNIKEVI